LSLRAPTRNPLLFFYVAFVRRLWYN